MVKCYFIRNDLLPESQKFAPEEFIIDKRIIESENSNLKLKLSSVEQNFCLNLQRSRILLKKLNHHFLNAIEVLPTKIHAEKYVKIWYMKIYECFINIKLL